MQLFRVLAVVMLAACLLTQAGFALSLNRTQAAKVVEVREGHLLACEIEGEVVEIWVADVFCPRPGQEFSREASEFTRSLVQGAQVVIEPKFRPRDRKWTADFYVEGKNLKYLLVKEGLAWTYLSVDEALKRLEQTSRSGKTGLWSASTAVPPWEYRPVTSLPAREEPVGSPPAPRADGPSMLFTDNEMLARSYDGEARHIRTASIPAAEGGEIRKLPPSRYDDFLNAVVLVTCGNSLGSGFYISPGGLVATNHHVVAGCRPIRLQERNGKRKTGTVVTIDQARDLALIRSDGESSAWLSLETGAEVGVGSEVIAIGAPEGLDWSMSRGIVSAIREGDFKVIQTDAAINPGNSGGPLVALESGKVIGMNSFKATSSEGLGFAIASEEIYRVFKYHLY